MKYLFILKDTTYFCENKFFLMSISSSQPQITVLRQRVEERFGKRLAVHGDFVALSDVIGRLLREHVSESTLERVWNYSTRGYQTISLRTLDVLASYAGYSGWEAFCADLRRNGGSQSELFACRTICSDDLGVGDRLRIGWLPDRVCEIRYLGDNRFVAEHCKNSTMQAGDTFRCLQFQVGIPLLMQDFNREASDSDHRSYLVGRQNGLTHLEVISYETAQTRKL